MPETQPDSRAYRPLSDKQRRFVETFDGNVSAAARAVGYAPRYAYTLVQKPHIRRAIEQRESSVVLPPMVRHREHRLKFFADIACDDSQSTNDRLRAAENLSKILGDYLNVQADGAAPVAIQINLGAGHESAPVDVVSDGDDTQERPFTVAIDAKPVADPA